MAGRSKSRAPITVPGIGLDLDVEFDREAEGAGTRIWRGLRSEPGFWICAVALVTLVTLAALASFISPHDPDMAIRGRGLAANGDPLGPTIEFPLGTDRLGRDYLSRLLHGARTSLIVGIGATFAASLLGSAVGGAAAYVGTARIPVRMGGRWFVVKLPVEALLMRLTDVVLSLPALLLAIALVAVIRPSLVLVLIVIAGLLWTSTARMVYSRVRLLRELEFVMAARALGASNVRILLRHIAPHLAALIVVYATLSIAAAGSRPSCHSWVSAFRRRPHRGGR
jgi:peptide/nickel transport system permease protein